jgi:hypothetical protein
MKQIDETGRRSRNIENPRSSSWKYGLRSPIDDTLVMETWPRLSCWTDIVPFPPPPDNLSRFPSKPIFWGFRNGVAFHALEGVEFVHTEVMLNVTYNNKKKITVLSFF